MSATAILAVILIYIAAQLGIALWASRRIHSESDFLVAGKSLGLGLASFSLFATWFGAETVMGSSGAIVEGGLAGSRADPFGYSICLLLMGLLLAAPLRRGGYTTLGDLFRERYGPWTEAAASLFIAITSLIWGAAQILAFAQVLSIITDTHLETALIVSVVCVTLYTLVGGMLADVLTDTVQGVVLIAGLVCLLVAVLLAAGGVTHAFSLIDASQLDFTQPGESGWSRFDTWMIPILGSLVAQEAISRLLATKNPETARRSCLLAAAIYLSVGLIPVLIALIGAHLPQYDFVQAGDGFLPSLAKELLHPWLFMLLAAALVSAILSTVNSTMLSVASLVSHNLVLRHLATPSERVKIRITRITLGTAGLAGYLIAMHATNIYELLELASSFGAAGVLVIALAGLWLRRGSELTALLTLSASIASLFYAYERELDAPFLLSLGVSLAMFVIGLLLEKMLARKKAVSLT